jgi:hypothetical protein
MHPAAALPEAIAHVLLTGELAPDGTPGRCEAFRLRSSTPEARARLRALWREHGPALTREWRRQHGPDARPWAAVAIDAIEAADAD